MGRIKVPWTCARSLRRLCFSLYYVNIRTDEVDARRPRRARSPRRVTPISASHAVVQRAEESRILELLEAAVLSAGLDNSIDGRQVDAAEHSLTSFGAVSVTAGESGHEGPRPCRKTCIIVPPRALRVGRPSGRPTSASITARRARAIDIAQSSETMRQPQHLKSAVRRRR